MRLIIRSGFIRTILNTLLYGSHKTLSIHKLQFIVNTFGHHVLHTGFLWLTNLTFVLAYVEPHIQDLTRGPVPQKARPVGDRNWPIGMAKPRAEEPPEVGLAERGFVKNIS